VKVSRAAQIGLAVVFIAIGVVVALCFALLLDYVRGEEGAGFVLLLSGMIGLGIALFVIGSVLFRRALDGST
jgi:hypothetical protein